MRKRNTNKFNGWPSWRYGPAGEAAIFQSEIDVPYGWTKKRGVEEEVFYRPEAPILDRDELVAQLIDLGVEIDQRWCKAHMKKVIDDCTATR